MTSTMMTGEASRRDNKTNTNIAKSARGVLIRVFLYADPDPAPNPDGDPDPAFNSDPDLACYKYLILEHLIT